MDDDPVQTQRCHKPEDALAIAQRWRDTLIDVGFRAPTPVAGD